MRVCTFSEARRNLNEVLDRAKREKIMIKRCSGDTFVVVFEEPRRSPFVVPGIHVPGLTTKDIIAAVRGSRSQPWRKKRKAKD